MYSKSLLELVQEIEFLLPKNYEILKGYENFEKYRKEIVKLYVWYSLLLSAYMYKRFSNLNEYKELIQEFIFDFCLAEVSFISKHERVEIISERFCEYDISDIFFTSFADEFERNKMQSNIVYTPNVGISQEFWIALSLHVLIKENKPLFPSRKIILRSIQKKKPIPNNRIESFIKSINDKEHNYLLEVFNITKEKLKDYLNTIQNEFIDLVKDSKEVANTNYRE